MARVISKRTTDAVAANVPPLKQTIAHRPTGRSEYPDGMTPSEPPPVEPEKPYEPDAAMAAYQIGRYDRTHATLPPNVAAAFDQAYATIKRLEARVEDLEGSQFGTAKLADAIAEMPDYFSADPQALDNAEAHEPQAAEVDA